MAFGPDSEVALSCGRLRSDSRTTAIAIAIASTARPATCPSMSRELSGRIAESVVALWVECFEWRLLGDTVGNRPDGLVGVVYAPLGKVGSVTPGRSKLGRFGISPTEVSPEESVLDDPVLADPVPDEPALAADATVIVALPATDVTPATATVAVSVICAPAVAPVPTVEPASISWAPPSARSTVQTLAFVELTSVQLPNVG